MTDYDDMMRGTAREWLWARIVLIGGFAVAIAVAGYFTWAQHKAAADRQAEIAQLQQQQEQTAARAQAEAPQRAAAIANERAGLALCLLELKSAKEFGIIPQFGKLAELAPRPTKKQGRYACVAATDVSKYVMTGDLVCRNLGDSKCMVLNSITRDDGTVLYQR